MKITVLCEDTSNCALKSEHGLSLYIESECAKILFDTGQSNLFYENAQKLGIDLSAADFAVISHGHYDHGGGLKKFLEINKKAPVYISAKAFGSFYNGGKYIGLHKQLENEERLKLIDEHSDICADARIFTSASFEKTKINSFGLTVQKNGQKNPDNFEHEIYLELVQGDKKVLFSGCSHCGIENIMNAFKPDIFIGGFHLLKLEDEKELEKTAKALSGYDTDYYSCHCTGEKQYKYLKKQVKRLSRLRTGDRILL